MASVRRQQAAEASVLGASRLTNPRKQLPSASSDTHLDVLCAILRKFGIEHANIQQFKSAIQGDDETCLPLLYTIHDLLILQKLRPSKHNSSDCPERFSQMWSTFYQDPNHVLSILSLVEHSLWTMQYPRVRFFIGITDADQLTEPLELFLAVLWLAVAPNCLFERAIREAWQPAQSPSTPIPPYPWDSIQLSAAQFNPNDEPFNSSTYSDPLHTSHQFLSKLGKLHFATRCALSASQARMSLTHSADGYERRDALFLKEARKASSTFVSSVAGQNHRFASSSSSSSSSSLQCAWTDITWRDFLHETKFNSTRKLGDLTPFEAKIISSHITAEKQKQKHAAASKPSLRLNPKAPPKPISPEDESILQHAHMFERILETAKRGKKALEAAKSLHSQFTSIGAWAAELAKNYDSQLKQQSKSSSGMSLKDCQLPLGEEIAAEAVEAVEVLRESLSIEAWGGVLRRCRKKWNALRKKMDPSAYQELKKSMSEEAQEIDSQFPSNYSVHLQDALNRLEKQIIEEQQQQRDIYDSSSLLAAAASSATSTATSKPLVPYSVEDLLPWEIRNSANYPRHVLSSSSSNVSNLEQHACDKRGEIVQHSSDMAMQLRSLLHSEKEKVQQEREQWTILMEAMLPPSHQTVRKPS